VRVSRSALPLVLVFLAGLVVGWGGARLAGAPGRERGPEVADPVVPRSAPPPRAEPGDPRDPPDLGAELADVRAGLELVLRRLDDASARVPLAPQDADGRDELTAERIAQIAAGVERRLAREDGPQAALQRLREERPEADWSALQPLADAWDTDKERLRKQVQLLSEAEVLRTYGSPDLTYATGEVVRWVYGRDYLPERDAYRLQLVFTFQDGLVRFFHVERL